MQAAIDAASEGDRIEVGPGTFSESIEVRLGLEIVGEGQGTTIINGGDSTRVARVSTFSTVVLTDLSITNGRADADGDAGRGAGISSFGADLVLRRVTVSDNFAREGGAGIDVERGDRRVEDSVIVRNTCQDRGTGNLGGGGIGSIGVGNSVNDMIVLNSLIADNVLVQPGTLSRGGSGIGVRFTNLVIRYSVIENNSKGIGQIKDFSGVDSLADFTDWNCKSVKVSIC